MWEVNLNSQRRVQAVWLGCAKKQHTLLFSPSPPLLAEEMKITFLEYSDFFFFFSLDCFVSKNK